MTKGKAFVLLFILSSAWTSVSHANFCTIVMNGRLAKEALNVEIKRDQWIKLVGKETLDADAKELASRFKVTNPENFWSPLVSVRWNALLEFHQSLIKEQGLGTDGIAVQSSYLKMIKEQLDADPSLIIIPTTKGGLTIQEMAHFSIDKEILPIGILPLGSTLHADGNNYNSFEFTMHDFWHTAFSHPIDEIPNLAEYKERLALIQKRVNQILDAPDVDPHIKESLARIVLSIGHETMAGYGYQWTSPQIEALTKMSVQKWWDQWDIGDLSTTGLLQHIYERSIPGDYELLPALQGIQNPTDAQIADAKKELTSAMQLLIRILQDF